MAGDLTLRRQPTGAIRRQCRRPRGASKTRAAAGCICRLSPGRRAGPAHLQVCCKRCELLARAPAAVGRCSAGHGVGGDVGDGLAAGQDLVGLAVGDLNRKLLLQRHHQLHRVQAVQAQVLLEGGAGAHLRQEGVVPRPSGRAQQCVSTAGDIAGESRGGSTPAAACTGALTTRAPPPLDARPLSPHHSNGSQCTTGRK